MDTLAARLLRESRTKAAHARALRAQSAALVVTARELARTTRGLIDDTLKRLGPPHLPARSAAVVPRGPAGPPRPG